jgi:hypothetical protein
MLILANHTIRSARKSSSHPDPELAAMVPDDESAALQQATAVLDNSQDRCPVH